MLTLQITKDQVFSLLEQLSWAEQQEVLQYLLLKPWASGSTPPRTAQPSH